MVRLIAHLLATRRPRRLLHCCCILISQRHGLWHVWRHRHRCRLGFLCGKHSGLLHLSHGGLHLLRCHGLLRKSSRQGICGLLRLGPHGSAASAGTLDFLHAFRVQAYRNHGAVAHVVLDGYGTAGVFQILLHHGKPCSGSTDIALHLAVCAGNAKVESTFLVVDAGSLVSKADGVSAVQNRDDGLGKVCVDKVFDNLADDHERDVATLFFHALVDGVGRLFQIRADILRINDDHTRCRQHVVIDGDARGVHGFWRLRCRLFTFVTLFAHAGDVLVVGCRVSGIDHGVKVVRHAARNLPKGFEQIVAHRAMFLIFRQLFKTC